MKIGRLKLEGVEPLWAVLDVEAGEARPLEGRFGHWAPAAALGKIDDLPLGAPMRLNLADLRAPHEPTGRIFGVGMNYQAHLTRLGHPRAPAHTIGYLKPASALVGPDADILYPPTTDRLDFEAELVAVLARPLGEELQASACLLGYTAGNDISCRDAGKRLGVLDVFGQKGLDDTAPLGPWIVTLDEFGGPGQPALAIDFRVNGETRQNDNTAHMLFPVDEILNYVDVRVRLRAGDLMFTGTPGGVASEDGRWLKVGDALETEIERIGVLCNRIGPKRSVSAARAAGRLDLPEQRPAPKPKLETA